MEKILEETNYGDCTKIDFENRAILGDILYLNARHIDKKFKKFYVATPRLELEKHMFDTFEKHLDKDPMIYTRVSNAIMQYTRPQMIKMFKKQNKQWTNWCDDVAIYFACRFVLFGEPIPVVPDPFKN